MYKVNILDHSFVIKTQNMFNLSKQLHYIMEQHKTNYHLLIGELYVLLTGKTPDIFNGNTVICLQEFHALLDKQNELSFFDIDSKNRILLLAHMVCFYSKCFCSPDNRKPVSESILWDIDKDVYIQLVDRANEMVNDYQAYKDKYFDAVKKEEQSKEQDKPSQEDDDDVKK